MVIISKRIILPPLEIDLMSYQKIAIIDLGTNTFHLMIAEKHEPHFHVLSRERIAVQIGMGGINERIITQAGIQRAIRAMKHFKSVMDEADVVNVIAFGTSALRNAKNGEEVATVLTKESGIPIKIISGEEEAGYIYRGVRAAVPMKQDVSLIVDVGGGSVEFIIANDDDVFWKRSFEIGAQRLLERFQKHDPIHTDEIEAVSEYLTQALEPLMGELTKHNPTVMIGSSGTFDTLSEIYCKQTGFPYSESFPETPLTKESFYQTFDALKQKNRAQRLQMPGMIEMRVDMIVVACCLIDFLLKKHAFQVIRVSTYSLKEGVLASLE
jgi:exopolyphosphatase/guanosine-5'-triphosphate,3'-diphosphate pyrophosphatase